MRFWMTGFGTVDSAYPFLQTFNANVIFKKESADPNISGQLFNDEVLFWSLFNNRRKLFLRCCRSDARICKELIEDVVDLVDRVTVNHL